LFCAPSAFERASPAMGSLSKTARGKVDKTSRSVSPGVKINMPKTTMIGPIFLYLTYGYITQS
jgi:hypothetical protein